MKVFSAAEMQVCDRVTTERFGVPSLELMRAASSAVATMAREHFSHAHRVTVLCGKGNNGGDGMMTARLLADAGLEVRTFLLGSPEELKGDAAVAWRELQTSGRARVEVVSTAADLARHEAAGSADLIVDAIVGTGFRPPLKGLALAALEWAKRSSTPILSVDLPSGWPSDETSARIKDPVFPSDEVVTFTAPKPAHVFGQLTRRWEQPILVVPIGSPSQAIVSEQGLLWAGSAMELVQAPRAMAANKGNFGHVLVVGGSFGLAGGKSGAPSMAALAALRTGAGLVTVAVPAPAMPMVAAVAPELMTWALKANAEGEATAENLEPGFVERLTKGMTVLAVGPGLGQSPETAKFLIGLLLGTKTPAVIDADALNILAAEKDLRATLEKIVKDRRTVVMTPHPGEMARLTGRSVAEVQSNRLETARIFARNHGVTLVLKGARTLIAHPDGRVAVNTTGNPAMAKGGSGDLLTGVIAGMLAQYSKDASRAVEAAVYLHGLAADFAVRHGDEHTLIATDSLKEFSRAFRFRSRGKNGYVWLQGLPAESSLGPCSHEAEE